MCVFFLPYIGANLLRDEVVCYIVCDLSANLSLFLSFFPLYPRDYKELCILGLLEPKWRKIIEHLIHYFVLILISKICSVAGKHGRNE